MSDGRRRAIRWVMSLVMGLGTLALFFSCQEDRRAVESIRLNSNSSTTTQEAVDSANFGAPTTQQWKAAGFRYPPARENRDAEEVKAENASCILCHGQNDSAEMHATNNHGISCVDCHGGERIRKIPGLARIATLKPGDPEFLNAKEAFHVFLSLI